MSATWSREVFAKNLKYYMDISGKNQKEMAEIVGVSAPTLNEWLRAKKYPRIDKIEKLAQYFGIMKSDLIEDKRTKANFGGKDPRLMSDSEFFDSLTDAERLLLEYYRNASDEARQILNKIVDNDLNDK